MRPLRAALPVLVVLLAALPAGAQEESARIQGSFVHDPAAGDDMEEVVDEGVSLVSNWLKRQFARGRIRETNVPYEWIRIEPRGDSVRVVTDQWNLTVPLEGTLEDWERADGDFIDVTAEWLPDGALRQHFQGEDGARENVYRPGPAGRTLIMEVTVTSDQLSGPLEYEQVYRPGAPE